VVDVFVVVVEALVVEVVCALVGKVAWLESITALMTTGLLEIIAVLLVVRIKV
jgi:hypothetical protein